ncbi:NCS2 family permease [Pediococcus acidilactici]|uniref:NCS2 family permease n=1 Tax=Pediococcus acidilactici TaxID=1254 RepID=UPI000326D871|nr:NCS2 family permease [Pediococcus acidilactici]EOA07738.1 xanthine/uracil/vitamin C permease [Pediococcus acidilactici D3]MBW4797966.1 NCS2 family permease [Pediococcus acidilactici]MBW9307109.1 NCS2 family permease [Pediococcus acidilactici]MCE5962635.1 NCS2 family permease [Pediococcus acidilactici]MDB8857864.1 NCS2 family permease [Pediococcus acidilactici]
MEQNLKEVSSLGILDKTFHLSENQTTVKREVLAGLTTFVSMAYILFVNPSILGQAGMDKGAVFTATALSAIIGCVLMAFLANYPIAVAPGLGDNAFFTFSVVLGMGIPWPKAMAGVFIASVLFTILSLVKVREMVIDAISQDLKLAMAAGIGIFIAFIGLQGGGLVTASKTSLVEMGSLSVPTTWLTIFGVFVIAILMARKVPGSIFIGLVATALLGLITGLIKMPTSIVSLAPSMKPTFGVGIHNLPSILDPQMWAVVLILLLVAFFDTAGTLIGLAQQAGIMKNNKMPRIGQALMADSFSMLAGSVMGTTPASAYVESSAGIAVGGKTGLTSLTVGILFVFSMLFSPLLTVVTTQVTAPALIIVGVLMASALREIQWDKFEIAMPAFLTIIGMPLTYNISYGMAFGFLTYPILMTVAGRRKEVNYIVWILMFAFVLMLYVLNMLPK